MTRDHGAYVVLALVFGGCGAKSELDLQLNRRSDGNGGVAGSSISAGGAAGIAGRDGDGGIPQDGAAGASVGGAGGTGGDGGVAGAHPANDIAEKIVANCLAVTGIGCSVELCLYDYFADYDASKVYDCNDELEAFLDCTSAHPFSCNPPSAKANAACDAESDTLDACLPSCTGTGSFGSCKLKCAAKTSWAVSCTPNGQIFTCTCTAGPNVGKSTPFPGCDWFTKHELAEFCIGSG